ncbi:MAG: DUF975 family protein [Prevotellaceae bacterium]|jgi:uncharacterized membrane protein|nr:DUF975 family protein [Prevotellaceae bacterium]
MLKLNSELRAEARASLSGKWGIAAVITLIMAITAIALFIPLVGIIFYLLVLPVLVYGMIIVFQKIFRGEQFKIGNLFDGFHNYGRVLGTMLLIQVYITLWSLLLVIPGIIKSYSYAMTPYLLRDNSSLSADELIRKSMKMMEGNKMKLFLLDLSFIGWMLLCILTLGIGLLWLEPYILSARAAFYDDICEQMREKNKDHKRLFFKPEN